MNDRERERVRVGYNNNHLFIAVQVKFNNELQEGEFFLKKK